MRNHSNIEEVNLNEIILPEDLITKISPDLMKQYQFIPISLKDNILTCVFGGIPFDNVVNNIGLATAYEIKVALASRDDIQKHLKELLPELGSQMNNKKSVKDKRKDDAKRKDAFFAIFMIIYCCFLGIPGTFGLIGNILVALVLYGVMRIIFKLIVLKKLPEPEPKIPDEIDITVLTKAEQNQKIVESGNIKSSSDEQEMSKDI